MVPVFRSRARALTSALACLLMAFGLTVLSQTPAHAEPPALLTPSTGEHVSQIPRLSWQRQAGAAKYDVQVSASDTFAGFLVNTNTVNSQYVPIVQLPAATLWWRVRITGSGDTGWATGWFVRDPVAGPTIIGPSGSLPQPEQPPVVSWTSIDGAESYTLEISTDQNFADPAQIDDFVTENTSLINPEPQVPNTYYTRVRAMLGNNVLTAWSNPGFYTVTGLQDVTTLSPAQDAVVTDTVLDWKPVKGAATYQVQVDDDVNFSVPVVDIVVKGTRYSPPKTVANDQYFWRVRPIDAGGNARAWTGVTPSVFQRAWPGQVHLEYPANSATVGNPFYYQWSPSERTSSSQEDLSLSSSYTLEVSEFDTFPPGSQTQRCDTVETTFVPQGAGCWPTASGTYYWRVLGHDDFGSNRPPTEPTGAEVHHFTYQPDVPNLLAPVGGVHVTIPTLSWSPLAGAARYRVTITPAAGGGVIEDDTASTMYSPRERLDPGSYSWQVQSLSQDGRLGTMFIFDQASFVVDPFPPGTAPTPAPLNSPSGRRFPTLRWTSVPGATRYEVWAKPAAAVAYTQVGDDFSYPAGESVNGAFLQPGDYDWFVKAINTDGGLISAGADGTFTINPLEVIPDDQEYAALTGTALPDDPEQPGLDVDADACRTQILSADNQSECDNLRNTPVLRWATGANVGYYTLYVSRDKQMTNPVSPLAVRPEFYTWRVRRIDASNSNGDWSQWRKFKIDAPAPTLSFPAAGATGVAPSDAVFTWGSVLGAETYRFERRVTGTLTTIEPATTRALSWAPQQAIAGGDWQWRVTAMDAAGANLSFSEWRAFSVTDTVAAVSGVSISGSGRVGTPLTLTSPTWNFGGDVTTTYQWFRGTSAIGGETGTTYTLTAANLAKNITVKATGTRPGYLTGTSTSNVIVGVSGNAPVAVTAVAVSGTGKVGTSLTATPPVWDNDSTTTTYQWQRDGANIGSATTTTYAVVAADVGHALTVRATGTRAGFDPGASVSDPVAGLLGDAPAATTDVSISGSTHKVGATLTMTAPTWNTAGVATTYQWFRDAAAITGSTGATYKLTDADVGRSVTVRATGTKSGYQSGTSTSNAIVGEALDPVVNTAAPTITGVAAARETLRASTGTWAVTSGVSYSYQWLVDGVAVAKETKETYVVRTRDAGLPVSVRVTATATGWAAGTSTSSVMPVSKLASTTTATAASKKITQKDRGVFTVKVAMFGYDVPLGQVQVKDGSKVIGTVALTTASNGTLTIRLKKLKIGKHKLTVTYLGSVSMLSSSAKVTIKVVKKPKK